MAEDSFDTTKPMLCDLERTPLLKQRNHINVLGDRDVLTFTNNRLQGIRKHAVETLSGATAKQLRRVYWIKWQYRAAQKVTSDLLKEGIWMKTHDGVRLVDSVPHTFDVLSLEEYVYENRICARRRNVDFSDGLQKALRELLYTARQNLIKANDREERPFFSNQDLCPVRDTKELVAALYMLRNMIFDFAEAKSLISLRQREVMKLSDANEGLRSRLGEAEASLSHLTRVEAELTIVRARCEELNEQLRQAQEGWARAKYQVQFLRRELKKERNQPPTTTEQMLKQKDNELVFVQQQIAKLRSKLYREVKGKESLQAELQEMKTEAVRASQKLEKRLSSGRLVGRERYTRVVASQLNVPRKVFSLGFAKMLKMEKIREEDLFLRDVTEDAEGRFQWKRSQIRILCARM
ncbi:hypothetical protein TraAM80_08650 [Trypanosoma rangeli]|uniref:Uncharacterized protein n=1 Tax=Trypanosoma rangeli TaxID=5698 RepID=A0A422MZM2_TRYRA|nr:uncharacterized protein TraAM80_08650 [Trypanosoma rangeli]RNE98659.1 hypothetical protein TraAM80_08650 [Trypanosoma rangeli]|eukprot:RNE98659.1 hypothetical protein TraAM80_08650 [Trypanosoma rangeli]